MNLIHLKNVNIRMQKSVQKLKLLHGEWSAYNWGRLFFNIDLDNNVEANIRLFSDNEIDSVSNIIDPLDNKNLIVQLPDSIKFESLNIFVDSIIQNNEVLLDSAEVSVQVATEIDTNYLQILSPAQGYKLFPDSKEKTPLKLVFSRPIELSKDSIVSPQIFLDDTVQVAVNIAQISSLELELNPIFIWQENANYKLQIPQNSIIDKFGRGLQDSLTTINFTTTKEIGYGSVNVSLTYQNDGNNTVAKLFSTKNPSENYTAFVNSKSQFEFKTVPEGNYSLLFFNDIDKNMKY